MNIHSLMQQFASFEGAELGHGPKHPVSPDLDLAKEIENFFHAHQFLQRDPGYVNFMYCYAGAGISREELMVDIYGFVSGGTHIVKEDGYRLDEWGYFAFCTIFLDDIKEIGFAFDATTERKPGVYRWTLDENLQASYNWYCATFLEWLERLIQYEGRLDG